MIFAGGEASAEGLRATGRAGTMIFAVLDGVAEDGVAAAAAPQQLSVSPSSVKNTSSNTSVLVTYSRAISIKRI